MSLFPSGQYKAYANYQIYFANQDEYNLAIAASGGNGFGHCPATAATKFGITPFPPVFDTLNLSKGIVSPFYSLSEPGTEINHPNPSGVNLSPSVDSVIVPGQTGVPAWGSAGPDMNLVWWGNIVKINGSAGENPSGLIPQRRWICGFEFGLGTEVSVSSNVSRESSRTIEGMGLSVRGDNLRNTEFSISNSLFRPGYQPTKSWERLYLRVKSYPSTNLPVWNAFISDFSGTGGCLILNSDGNLSTASILGYNPTVLDTTSTPLELKKQYKVDIIFECNQSGAVGIKLRLWLNGSLKLTSQGLNDASYVGKYHIGSTLCRFGVYDNLAAFDLDDWVSADVPDSLNSLDWKTGSHVRKHYNTALTGWDGHFEQLNQLYNAFNNQMRQDYHILQ